MEDGWEKFEPVGEFREDRLSDRIRSIGRYLKNRFKKAERPKPYFSDDLIKEYKFFRENIHNPKRVFYPCCNLDASPLKGFPDSEVVLMDNEQGLDKIMKQNGVSQFILGDVLTYNPKKPFDLVILLNPLLNSRDLTKHLSNKGYVLSNNWCNNASQLLEDSKFEGIGTIDRTEKGIYLARGDFSKLEPNQFATYFYVFRKLGEENGL
jgi:hypothetical protein